MRLDENDHEALVLWAADCAEHVLPHFEERYPNDDRPRKAVEAGRAWARGMRSGALGKVGEFLGQSGVMPDSSAMAVAQIRAARWLLTPPLAMPMTLQLVLQPVQPVTPPRLLTSPSTPVTRLRMPSRR